MNYDELSREDLIELLIAARADVRRYRRLRNNPAGPWYTLSSKFGPGTLVLAGGEELDKVLDETPDTDIKFPGLDSSRWNEE